MLQDFVDDDGLIRHLAGDAIGAKKIDRVELIGLHVLAQVLERRPIQQRAAVPVVDVFPDEQMTRGGDLPLELRDMALNGSFFLLRVCAHACIQGGLCHTLH